MSASFSAMFSTMSSYIYYPALVPVAHNLGVSVALVNLSVTTYLIVAAIAPAFMGDMADQTGRRPVFMVLFVLMISANAGDCPPNIIRRSPGTSYAPECWCISTGSNYIRSYRRYRRIQRQRRLCRRLSQPACFHPPTNTPHLPPVNIHHSTGKFLDWNYRHTSSRFQATTNETDIFPPRKKPPSAASTSSSSSAPSAP
ncbi:uncharacterized protein PODANS_5_760 [Podospora anserina S mat+]|uniref:Podospora anserina S mat+ genomic DNA chromosome 5, supercontig 1 n=1 Tax=Podospora anserina (strain S / ATCC MYA-4624 / DSM 980 / FGSC 10383) TaxID=515849 RepID=B2AF24_PODAN|nr:uncharacterized protein PODANS_5_760 [Podospora anserina S mat+]CAP62041.1 unnamed protein product [Podospora anserina S mat+]CDP29117.1 Putative protein of unknown function [Podospora anserina S mat+]